MLTNDARIPSPRPVPGDARPPPGLADTTPDQVRALLRAIPVGFAGSLIPAAILAWVFSAHVSPVALIAWFGWMVFAHAVRFVVWSPAHHDRELAQNAYRWLFWLRASTLLLGLSWAVLPLAMAPANPFDQLLIAAVISAIAGAGMAQLSADVPSVLLFILPPAVPTAARLFASPDPSLQAVGVLVLLYFIYLTLAAHRIQQSFLELSRLHSQASIQSLHDTLTGLPNRFALHLRLQDAIERAQRNGTEVAVAYLDLDDFKHVNDSFGHDAGDVLLRTAAKRWRAALRESEMVARLGGDEFVLVIESLDPEHPVKQLTALFDRVERVMAPPVTVAPHQTVRIGMTMGVARYPVDGTGADELLRRADAAMYQLKLRKATRHNWWQLGTRDPQPDQPEAPMSAYGTEAAAMLAEHAPLFEAINAQFIDAFYLDLDQDAEAKALLRELDEAQFTRLKASQSAYLRFIASSDTTLETLTQRARVLGVVHYLAGVSGSMLARTSVRYRTLLSERVAATRLPPQRRYRLLSVVGSRLQDELQAQFSAGEEVASTYLAVLSRPRPAPGTLWPDAVQHELNALAELRGIVLVTLRRLNRDGALVVEHSASAAGAHIPANLFDGNVLPEVDPGSPAGQSATSVAWRTEQIARIDSWLRDPRVLPWRDIGMRAGIHSHVAIPFSGPDNHVAGVVTVYGGQPNQFASPWMRQWGASVRHRMELIWAQSSTRPGPAVLSEQKTLRYREQLFAGGLEMYVQPIVNLQTGQVSHVEALARLRMPDGEIVSPGVFLPPLGDIELDRVFRAGLDQALDALQAWDAQGLSVDASINLPPSTLLDGDCALWVQESLNRHAVAPHRLSLELLEAQTIDPESQREAIQRLRDIGIRLSMDDLGSGYSSIERLSTFKFDTIKIDQSLIRRIHDRPIQTITLIGTLVLLGADLGQNVVVEGVEDAGMLEVATVFGAQYGQGYAIAAPMPVNRFADWVRGFAAPPGTGTSNLSTYAGALAFHWRYVHLSNNQHPADPASCPLGRFLEAQGYAGTDVAHWHDHVHSAADDAAAASAASSKLLNWLADKVMSERPDT